MCWKCQKVAAPYHFCQPLGISGFRHVVSMLGNFEWDEVCMRVKTILGFGPELYFVNDLLPYHNDYCIQRSQI